MKRLSVQLSGILGSLLLFHTAAQADEDKAFLGNTIKAKLREPSDIFNAKYGRRSITLMRLATSDCEVRLALWTLMGEPVQTYEFRMPRLRELIFEADDGFANRVTVSSVGDSDEDDISFHGGSTVYVSQNVLDKIQYVGFSFSIDTHHLSPLPEKYRSEPQLLVACELVSRVHPFVEPGRFEITGELGLGLPLEAQSGMNFCPNIGIRWKKERARWRNGITWANSRPKKHFAACGGDTTTTKKWFSLIIGSIFITCV